jgi:DNA-binding winged helix-turn-helix (wHTH) protein
MEPVRPTSVVRFGTYEVSLQSGEVRKAGLRIRVQQQPLKLLEILLERPGEVVTREELRSRVWSDESFGDFDQAVNIAIAKLRNALGDSAENPRFIETLPKRGYRFIADVSVVDADARPKSWVGGCAPTKAAAGASAHHRVGARRELADYRCGAISFAWPCSHWHPISSGASAGEPVCRCFTELLR